MVLPDRRGGENLEREPNGWKVHSNVSDEGNWVYFTEVTSSLIYFVNFTIS